jgi:hypothetical protein
MFAGSSNSYNPITIYKGGFAPGFVNYKKGYTRLAAASDNVYQLLVHGRECPEKTTDLPQVAEKLYYIILHREHPTWTIFELTTLVLIKTDCIGIKL